MRNISAIFLKSKKVNVSFIGGNFNKKIPKSEPRAKHKIFLEVDMVQKLETSFLTSKSFCNVC